MFKSKNCEAVLPAGKIIEGSSSFNNLLYARESPANYDGYRLQLVQVD